MKVKTAIRIIDYSDLFAVAGILLLFISFVAKQKDGWINYIVFGISVVSVCSYFVRRLLITNFLKRTRYPGVFYSVLDKMKLNHKLEIPLTDELLNDIYRPAYTTNEFVADNQLKTEIGSNKFPYVYIVLIIGFSSLGLLYFASKLTSETMPIGFSLSVIGLLIASGIAYKSRSPHNDPKPIAIFSENEFKVRGTAIQWGDLFDWAYYHDRKGFESTVTLHYYSADKTITNELKVFLSELNISHIDFMLLLTHFKAKYGDYHADQAYVTKKQITPYGNLD
jgi:hypothetical protein